MRGRFRPASAAGRLDGHRRQHRHGRRFCSQAKTMQVINACLCRPVPERPSKWPKPTRPAGPPCPGGPYFSILATTPAPTVRPPSRMAKRSPSSMAMGAISSTSIDTLSPGITISTPSGSFTTPVTSVVRK
jgi:hypothetical protein